VRFGKARAMNARKDEFVPEITRVSTHRVCCDGSNHIRSLGNVPPAALGHPRVYLEIDDDDGFVDCPYCDRRFILVGGVADKDQAGETQQAA